MTPDTGYGRSGKTLREVIPARQEGKPLDPQKLLRNLGQVIRHHRREAKMTMSRLAEVAGINSKYLGEVELGKANPTFLFLLRVVAALGIEMTDLFFNCQIPLEENAPIYAEIMALLRTLDQLDLQKLLRTLRVIIGPEPNTKY